MAFRQITKYKRTTNQKPLPLTSSTATPKANQEAGATKRNNVKKNKTEMNEKVNKAEEIMNNMKEAGNVKVIKKDKGLIERTESSKIVLTEDNRQVLND